MKPDENEIKENHAWNRLSMWELIVDERIRSVIGDGDMSWHPGAGKPIQLEDGSYVPEDERIARKIMKDHDAVPPWMALAFTLRDKHAKLVNRAVRYAQDYVRRSHEALLAGSFVRDQHARERWLEATQRLHDDISRYNGELLDYNLQVPSQVQQMIPLNAAKLIEGALNQARQEFSNDWK